MTVWIICSIILLVLLYVMEYRYKRRFNLFDLLTFLLLSMTGPIGLLLFALLLVYYYFKQ